MPVLRMSLMLSSRGLMHTRSFHPRTLSFQQTVRVHLLTACDVSTASQRSSSPSMQLAYIGWYFASRAERVTATVADTEYRVRFADRGFLEYSDWKCAMGMAKLYSKRSILRIARRQQLGPRTTLAVSVVRELCRALGISYTSAERRDTLMRRVAAVLRREM